MEWKSIPLNELFTISPGQRLETRNKTKGEIPFIGATDNNNGVTGFVGNKNASLDCNVLGVNYNGAPCIAFYHPYDCIFTDDVKRLHLKGHKDNQFVLLFFVSIFAKQRVKYSYGYKFNEQRMLRQKLQIPESNNQPDYNYMSEYIKAKKKKALDKYKAYIEKQLSQIKYKKVKPISEMEWKPFSIVDLFNTFIAGKGGGLNHLVKTDNGGINYIGATNRNNGVLCYVAENDMSLKKVLHGNCIGFIKNGDGSAGYAIYKAESFISTNDVIYGYADWLNKYTGLFFVAAQDMIENKYSHGYKRNMEHLKGDKIMLPVNDNNEPDYAYMEQYAKNMMYRKYQQYLAYLDKKQHGQC